MRTWLAKTGDALVKLLDHKASGVRATFQDASYGTLTKSPTIAQLNAYLQQFSLASLLPYRSYDPSSHIFYSENSVGFVLEIPPLVGCTEEMQRELSGLFRHTLPEKSNLQFMLWADPKIGGLFEKWVDARQDNGEIFKTLAKKRTTFLAQKIFNSEHIAPPRNMRCIISYTESGQSITPVSREKLLQIQDQIKTALKSLGVSVYLWCAEDLLQTLDGILNIDHSINPCNLKWNSLDVLNKQILKPGNSLLVDKNALLLNEEFAIRTYSVRRAPDQWSLHAMGELIGDHMRDLLQIPCPFIIHYGVCISDQDKTKIRVQSRESWVERQAQSKIGKKIPILIKQSRELDFVRHQQSKGERFVQTYFSVSLLCAKNQLNQADQMLLNLFRSHRFDLQCDAYIQLPSLLSMLPMAWGEGITKDLTYLQKTKTTLSTEAANLLPLQGEWKGTSSSGMLLKGRRGQIFTFSPFDNNEGNYNVCVVGKSGSGKSVFMQDLVATTLGQGGQVFVLDCGRSFEKTVKLLHGEYIAFTPDANLCINPFSTIPCDNSHATKDALAMLKPIVSLMAAPKDGTSDLENAYLEKAITVAWEKKEQHASLSDVADYLKAQRDQLAKNLGYKLHPYAKGGVYSRFFNGPATVDLAAKMVVVELEELKERKDLQEVIVQMIILQITNKLYLGDRETPAHVVLDEAWDMLRGQQSGTFIETAARRLRKYKGSLVVGTQSINDFYATPAARAAFENADWMCLLAQKAESIKQLKESKRLTMDPAMEQTLTSLRTKQGQYAEIMICGPHGYATGRLLLDPYSLILYSTKPEEFAAVQALTKKGLSLASAIENVALENTS